MTEYFSFTRKERTGIITVMLLIILLVFLPFLFPYFLPQNKYDHSRFEKEIAALKIRQTDSNINRFSKGEDNNSPEIYPASRKNYFSKEQKGELFYFDPNNLSAEGWQKLGVKEKTAQTIQNYISKGGRFNQPEDLGKIWGLHIDEVNRLLPYVQIEKKNKDKYVVPEKKEYIKQTGKNSYTKTIIDINAADTSALIALPGIGSKLANRIIAFRDRLGGFYSVDQVAETYALPDSTFRKIKDRLVTGDISVRKININTETLDELKAHPYIRYNIANAILQYRTVHGDFTNIAELKNILIITADVFNKLEPYLTIR